MLKLQATHVTIERLSSFKAVMAVPKKKTSKAKRDQRKAHWKRTAAMQAEKALSLGKSVLTGRSKGFVYPSDEEEDDEE